MTLVERIKILCKEHNTSIPKLEEEFKLGRGAIYKWDVNRPTIDKVQRVADYFGATIDSMVRGCDPTTETPEPFDSGSLLERIRGSGLSVGQVIAVLDQAKAAVLNETPVGN
jgi:transcriptional regulator with XRE-family HTH domain